MKISEYANHGFVKKLRVVGWLCWDFGRAVLSLSCKLSNKILTGQSSVFLPFSLSPSSLWPSETSNRNKA